MTAPEPEQTQAQAQPQPQRPARHFPATRTSRAWWALGAGVFMLLLVVIFMAQNDDKVDVKFLWITAHDVTLAVALFLAAIMGAAVVLLLGAARILQVRRQAKRGIKSAEADPR
jgi:uncharacterized integral membrane protein